MLSRTRFKPFLSFKFTNPSTHAIQVISEDIGDLLPWNTCTTGLDGEVTYFGVCCFHTCKYNPNLDNLKVEMLKNRRSSPALRAPSLASGGGERP
jgi:hypothetical protein